MIKSDIDMRVNREDIRIQYESLLLHPPASARGLTRWWWYGCAATCDEITKELNAMREAGLGGVELQIIYPLAADDDEKNIRNIPYFSPEFFDLLDFTARECKKLGMRFDYTLGSGWPYGGPFVTEELAMQCAIPYQIDLRGPQVYSEDMTTRFVGEVAAASIGRMEDSVMLPETVRDVTHHFKERYLFNWVWGKKLEGIEIPEGNWKLCFFVIHRYRQPVGKAAPGAEGLVIDHCSRKAMDCFLENMAQPLTDRLGKGTVDSFFCDSIECDGHNWSSELLEAFEQRRGYDLRKFIYALWGDMGEITPHVRYDYFLTMSELTIENFFDPLTEWCRRNGSRSRIQAHGTWGDILRVYAAADEPEGETFGDHRQLECNSIHRRMAVSAGHLYGKNIISNETFTWLGIPRFTETLEDMKASVDGVFLDGINQIVNHGYSLTHENADEPGWSFYASCHINHTNTWWKYYRHLGEYIHKVSAFLRLGVPCVEVGIYLPQADIWAENMLSDVHLAMRLEDRIGRSVADRINKEGYWFDYLNDEALTEFAVPSEGGIRIQNNVYRVILLINCHRLPPQTALTLERFQQSGGILIAAGGVPADSCGLTGREERRQIVSEAMERCFNGEKNRYIAPDSGEGLLSILRAEFAPDVLIEKKEQVGYVHRIHGSDHIYFLANVSPQRLQTLVSFKNRTGGCFVLPTEGEQRIRPLYFKINSDTGIPRADVILKFEPYQSVFVIFPGGMDPAETVTESSPKGNADAAEIELTGWDLSVNGQNVKRYPGKPDTWEKVKGLEHYSGEGVYRTIFAWKDILYSNGQAAFCYDDVKHGAFIGYRRAILQLKKLYCAATVFVNGHKVGDIWKAPYELDIAEYLTMGENSIEIRVVNTLFNRIIGTEQGEKRLPAVIDKWPYFGNIMNNIWSERQPPYGGCPDERRTPMPSGISGSVVLKCRR
ncbi:MAG TPA: hypothetical protein GXZ29_10475 [Clostridiales bacterium]|nr:hypothetical protein [Clostridiales bacterium]